MKIGAWIQLGSAERARSTGARVRWQPFVSISSVENVIDTTPPLTGPVSRWTSVDFGDDDDGDDSSQ